MDKVKKFILKSVTSIRRFFKSLSLLQQLGLLIFGLLLFVVVVVSPIINRNLNDIISRQMFETIRSSQDAYFQNYYNPYDRGKDKQVYHIIRYQNNNTVQWEAVPPLSVTTTRELVQMIFDETVQNQTATTANYIAEFKGERIYYTVTWINENESCIISFLYNDYSTELVSSIRNELIYVQYIVLLAIGLIMALWVWTLIKPLHKIKNYIDTIREGESGTLSIHRGDEIGEVSSALVYMKNELDKQEKLKEEFMHNISHDLKTPIAVIRSYAQSMKDDIYPYGTKEASLDVILENTERLEEKVKLFLYLNRLDYINQEELVLEDVDINELVDHIVSQLDLSHNVIDVIEEDQNVIFLGQKEHWRNVIENIIENAKRYYKEKIVITIRKNEIIIFNDGPAISESLIEDIFKPYSKGEKGNFGLGLSIVKKVVDMYHYRIKVENVENGVQFKIYKE